MENSPDTPYIPDDLSLNAWNRLRDSWEASPANWYADATRWKTAARTLVDRMLRLGWPSPPPRHRATVAELDRAAVLLYGLALECLVKGFSLHRTWKTARTIGHHAGKEAAPLVECSQRELDLFSRLEECVSTIGRYPIPDNGTPGTIYDWESGRSQPVGMACKLFDYIADDVGFTEKVAKRVREKMK